MPRIEAIDGARLFFENAHDAYFVVAADGLGRFHFQLVNGAFLGLTLPNVRDARGCEPHEVLAFPAATALVKELRTCLASSHPSSLPLELPVNGINTRWQFRLTPFRDPNLCVEWVLGQAWDCSEQHAQAARLERSYRLLERIAETTREIVFVFDRVEARNVYVNHQVYGITGYQPHELREMKGDYLNRLVHEEDLPRLLDHLAAFDRHLPGHVATIEYRLRHANGHYIWLASRDTILSSDLYAYARRIIGSAVDITQQRHMLHDLQTITQRVLDTQNQERRRIARELHDSTAQHLVAASLGMGTAERMVAALDIDDRKRSSLHANMAEARRSLAEAQREIRTLSYLLHPPEFDDVGLVETLRRFTLGFSRRTGIRTRLSVAKTFSCTSRDIEIILLRIAQESLINVYRHAEASRTEVRLGVLNGHYAIEIEDDGKGFPGPEGDKTGEMEIVDVGVGIPGMRARVQQFHGQLYLLKGRHGALLRAAIPQERAPHPEHQA